MSLQPNLHEIANRLTRVIDGTHNTYEPRIHDDMFRYIIDDWRRLDAISRANHNKADANDRLAAFFNEVRIEAIRQVGMHYEDDYRKSDGNWLELVCNLIYKVLRPDVAKYTDGKAIGSKRKYIVSAAAALANWYTHRPDEGKKEFSLKKDSHV